MKSHWTERYDLSLEALEQHLHFQNPSWDPAQVRLEAQQWLQVHQALDHYDYNLDHQFYRRQHPCADPHEARSKDSSAQDDQV